MKYYLLSICLLPFAYWLGEIVAKPLLPAGSWQFPPWAVQIVGLYFAVGAAVLLIDLWRSKRVTADDRLWWTVALLCFGFLLAPLYWFMVVKDRHQADCSSNRCE